MIVFLPIQVKETKNFQVDAWQAEINCHPILHVNDN
jgi:hypothetical protein